MFPGLPRRTTLTAGVLLSALALLLLSPGPAAARPSGKLVPSRGAHFGAYVNPTMRWGGDMTGRGEVKQLEAALGRRLDLVHTYHKWDEKFPRQLERWSVAGGRIPVVSWEGTSLDRVLNGSQDRLIRVRARAVKRLKRAIFIRWGWEMNGTWNPWSGAANGRNPGRYVAAWRRIHGIFREERATNAVWVWCPNGESVPGEPWNHWRNYYPGDRYVDWVGIDMFNWGSRRSWSSWRSFASLFAPVYSDYARRKPIMIAETGSVEAGGSKARWIDDARRSIKRAFPSIGAFVWFHANFVEDWRVDSSADAFAAFRGMAKDPYFHRRGGR
jgi:hypothetical protein